MLKCLLAGAAGLALLPASPARAQPARADSVLLAAGVRAVALRYAEATQGEGHLLNGPQYVEHRREQFEGSPYFPDDRVRPGAVLYDGFAFEQVPLRYDAHTDQVLFYPASRAVVMRLVPQKLTGFTVGGHHFVRLETDSAASPQARSGFYELLADGPARLLVRHVKRTNERPLPNGLKGSYYDATTYLVQQGGAFTAVTRLSGVTKLFPAYKTELRRYARTQHLSFRDLAREQSLTQLLRYLNRLLEKS